MSFDRFAWHERLLRADMSDGKVRVGNGILTFADGDGEAWPSVSTISERCRIKPRAVQIAIRALEAAGLLTTQPLPPDRLPNIPAHRRPSLYRLVDGAHAHAPRAGRRGARKRHNGAHETDIMGRMGVRPNIPLNIPLNNKEGAPDGGAVFVLQVDDGKLAVPTGTRKSVNRKLPDPDAEAIYQHYPLKVGKLAALPKIRIAIDRVAGRGETDPVGWLINRVKCYAASRQSEDEKYTPHPATWFHNGRYDDEIKQPSTAHGRIAAKPVDYFADLIGDRFAEDRAEHPDDYAQLALLCNSDKLSPKQVVKARDAAMTGEEFRAMCNGRLQHA